MTKKIAFWIFMLGTVSSAILFLYLTYDTHVQVETLSHVDNLSQDVIAGKRVFEKYNCNDCHTILGFGAYYAPDLTKVVQRIGGKGIRYSIKNPAAAFANSWRKMPQFNVSDDEVDKLIVFFSWVGEINNGDWPPQDSKERMARKAELMVAGPGLSPGAALYQTKGCMNCHSLHGEGGTVGPPHDHVGKKLTLEQIGHYIRNPERVNPEAIMPPQDELSDKEVEEIAKFLATMK